MLPTIFYLQHASQHLIKIFFCGQKEISDDFHGDHGN